MTDLDTLRRHFRAARRAVDPILRTEWDAAISAHLRSILAPFSALCAYRCADGEPSVDAAIEIAMHAGKAVYFPRFDTALSGAETPVYTWVQMKSLNTHWTTGKWAIPEPAPDVPSLDGCAMTQAFTAQCAALVPGVAFAADGRRIGRGKGIYDQFLSRYPVYRIGVFYDLSEDDTLYEHAHDQRMDLIVTPTRVLAGSRRLSTPYPMKETLL